MASKYQFSEDEIRQIEQARQANTDRRAEARLKALELRAKGSSAKAVSEATGFHKAYVPQLVAKYREHGLEAICGNHYGGNRRNMSLEDEAAILKPFEERVKKGETVEVKEIKAAYQAEVEHPIGNRQIYRVLKRHGWRKAMPRGTSPEQAGEEVIEASRGPAGG